jgi:trigger factor
VKLAVERKPESLVVLDIAADEDEFAEAMKRAFRKVSRDIQIPGFRKGHAPRPIIERYYGRDVFLREAADDMMERLYRDALKQEDLTPVGEPEVEIKEMEPVAFAVTVPVYPTIELGDYSDVRAEPQDASVDEAEVDEVIERMRKSQSPWVDPAEPRTPREGDQVTVDYEVKEGDEEFQEPITDAVFILGESNLLEPLKEKLEEMHVDQTEEFDLTFAEDDESVDARVRGKTLHYIVTLKGLKERDLVEVNDEFAQNAADAESVEDLRKQIRDDLHQGRTSEKRTEVLNGIVEQITERATIDLPSVMIDEEVDHRVNQMKQQLAQSGMAWDAYLRVQDQTEDEVRAETRPAAEQRLRNSMALQELAKRENLEVTHEDIHREIDQMMQPPAGQEEDLGAAERDQMRQFYNSEYFHNLIRSRLFEERLSDRLIDLATEGKGAVVNGWVAPEPAAAAPSGETEAAEGTEAGEIAGDEEAADQAAQAPQPADEGTTEPAAESTLHTEHQPEEPAGVEGTDWVRADASGEVPAGFPIKGNASSKLYHPEGTRFYNRTDAEFYFATPEAAEAAGYQLPPSLRQTGEQAADAVRDAADAAAAKAEDAE